MGDDLSRGKDVPDIGAAAAQSASDEKAPMTIERIGLGAHHGNAPVVRLLEEPRDA
ncbi:hypothetical protein [Methyloceanibacter sp.]|uniref:hypothetical protein n=1 Tax=Methyloceanibacter sp. TaxID=1965321 RepID=UPI002D4A736D|nr:hypothetical protein [Methyloceanibacter sp.]HZP08567.1 hypothetical protein [Methyloceanibacter sp.]